jgi:uncharacterized protein (DUF433 family)
MSIDIYNGKNPLDMPLYTYADASRYIGVPTSTLKAWAKGRPRKGKQYDPLIKVGGDDLLPLSFHNLVELHILSALQRIHGIRTTNIRKALNNAKKHFNKPRVLLSEELFTFGQDMFIDELGEMVNLTKGNQIVLKDILKNYFRRVERDDSKIPVRFYPMIKGVGDNETPVSIDPRVSFGRPVVKGTGIRTKIIADRVDAGESIKNIADDYSINEDIITQVLYYEKAA